jgi:hypothetical protein
MLAAQNIERARQAPEVDATNAHKDLGEIWLSPSRGAGGHPAVRFEIGFEAAPRLDDHWLEAAVLETPDHRLKMPCSLHLGP